MKYHLLRADGLPSILMLMSFAMVFAADFRAIGLTVAVVVLAGFVLLFIRNSFQARPELGSEIELAANRKPYYDDETLEGPRLERVQLWGVILLMIIVVALPLSVFVPFNVNTWVKPRAFSTCFSSPTGYALLTPYRCS
mgnify:CR=1 FL=1